MRDTFCALNTVDDVKTVVVTGAGGNFCSGGDVHEIIGPLTQMKMPGLLAFTRMTGDLVKAMRAGLAGADMGACSLLPRIIGQGRASELLYTGRSMGGDEAERFGFYNAIHEPEKVLAAAQDMARPLADGPTFAHGMTKKLLHQEWNMGLDEAIEAEAEGQAAYQLAPARHVTLNHVGKFVRRAGD